MGKAIAYRALYLYMSHVPKFLAILLVMVVAVAAVPTLSKESIAAAKAEEELLKKKLPDLTEFCALIKDSDTETYAEYCTK